MRRSQAVSALRAHESEAREFGALSLYLFGSTARDEARQDSDIDLFIDPDYGRFGLVELFRLEETLSRALGRTVELTTRKGLHPLIRDEIEREAVKVFG